MSDARPTVVSIAAVAPSEVAALHLQYLVTPFRGRAGQKLLELYYDAFAHTEDAFGLVAMVDGHIAGFACVARDTRHVQLTLLRRTPLRLAWRAVAVLAQQPRLVVDLLKRLRGKPTERIHWQRPEEWSDWWPYRPLVVATPYRKHGVADLLMQSVLEEARRRGIRGLIGTSERANAQSRVNLVRNGYQEVWRDEDYVVFVRAVDPQPDARLERSQ